jgi:RHS repeat-associated protein
MLRSGATSFYNADGLGTITSLANTTGSLAQTYTFDSFGNATASSGSLTNPFRFTGREFDGETSLYFNRARYLDPNTGRFLTEDPTWQALTSGNLYVYVDNDPTIAIDPSGLTSIFYDGKDIRVFDDSGKLLLKCRGTSGRPGRGPADQAVPYQGPLPRGSYWIDPTEISCVSGFRYWLRNKLGDWGHCRLVLHPFPTTNTYGRGTEGFFLHGGVTPGSAGCLDSGDCDTNIFKILNGSHGLVRVDVNYTQFQPF